MALIAVLALLLALPRRAADLDPVGRDAAARLGPEGGLQVFQVAGDQLVLYRGGALSSGERIEFQAIPGMHHTLVLLAVDGAGDVRSLLPEVGEEPAPLPDGLPVIPLPVAVTLGPAEGDEVFVAVFDRPVEAAKKSTREAWDKGGSTRVLDWARAERDADAVVVKRR
jgi:hypothetical protein